MGTVWLLISFIFAVILISTGLLLVYSAFTGKGVKKPEPNESFGIKLLYKLRAITGVGFIFSGVMIFFLFIDAW